MAFLEFEERNSALWLKLKTMMKADLDMLRAENDKELPPEKTAKLRGRIDQIKRYLDIERDETPISDD